VSWFTVSRVDWRLTDALFKEGTHTMKQREKASRRNQGRGAGYGIARRGADTGLAVEGPGFLVWDEVASDARRRAGELWTAASWRIRLAPPRR